MLRSADVRQSNTREFGEARVSTKRFRIAFSFAGEKRPFVAEVAKLLAARFGEEKILYDKFHEAEFAHADLGFDLPKLYKDEADLIVAVFCRDYDRKPWCGLEYRAIFALIKEGATKQVLLTRFDYVDGKGLFGLGGFLDLDKKSAPETERLILERLALNEGLPKGHYTAPPAKPAPRFSTTTPNNLPRLQPFFGREKELAQLRDALDPESRTWGALIDGPGGMGKTSLAMRAAYDCPPGLFERIVFVSVKDRELDDNGERKLGNLLIPGFLEMLNEIARELKVPDFAKLPESERIRKLLDELRDQRVLLVLDNLESIEKSDRDQLLTFVKRLPQGCKALLTSRRRIGSGADTLILEKLGEAAALETLDDLALRNPLLARTTDAERTALYERTAGKPLLLRWVAGQLGRGRCRTLADAFTFLAKAWHTSRATWRPWRSTGRTGRRPSRGLAKRWRWPKR